MSNRMPSALSEIAPLTDDEIVAAWNGAGTDRPEAGAADLYLHYMRAIAKAQREKSSTPSERGTNAAPDAGQASAGSAAAAPVAAPDFVALYQEIRTRHFGCDWEAHDVVTSHEHVETLEEMAARLFAPSAIVTLTKGEVETLIDHHDQMESAADAMGVDGSGEYHRKRREAFKSMREGMK